MIVTKICPKCKQDFLRTKEYFYSCKSTKDGLDHQCKTCKLQTTKNYQSNNKDKVKQSKQKNYNTLKEKENRAKRYQKNREQLLKKKRDNYIHTRNLRCYMRGLIGCTKANAKKKGLEHTLTTDFLLDILEKQNNKCALTGVSLTYISGQGMVETNISVDRIDPSKGYTLDNIWLVCIQANQMKTNMTLAKLKEVCNYIINNLK